MITSPLVVPLKALWICYRRRRFDVYAAQDLLDCTFDSMQKLISMSEICERPVGTACCKLTSFRWSSWEFLGFDQ